MKWTPETPLSYDPITCPNLCKDASIFHKKNCENFPEKLNSNLSGKKNIESAYKETGRLYFNELINLGH